jgi:hypothetical protein
MGPALMLMPPSARMAATALFLGLHTTDIELFRKAKRAFQQGVALAPSARFRTAMGMLESRYADHTYPDGMGNNSLVRQRNRALIVVLAAGNLLHACTTLDAPEGRAPAAAKHESSVLYLASLATSGAGI